MSTNARWRKGGNWAWLALVLVGLVLVNIIASQFFFRLDLTEDKRYSINPATQKLLSNMQDVVYVEVFLEGEFPAGFERLQRSIRETLEEFRIYAGDKLQFKFTDPTDAPDDKTRQEMALKLVNRGIQATNLYAQEEGKQVSKLVFPGAIVSYGENEVPVMLLKGNKAASAQERLNQSVEGVEYELASGIKKALTLTRKKVAVIYGHGEPQGANLYDLITTLKKSYEVDSVHLPNKVNLEGYDAALVVKPRQEFSEPDKFKLDQFVVNGGRLLFFLDALDVTLDSIKPEGEILLPLPHKLDDLLFQYGVRVNNDLLMDMTNARPIPLVVGYEGDRPATRLVPWRYFPILNKFGEHPTVRNMDALSTTFVSSIDTVLAKGIRKTPLAFTGQYTRIMGAPVRMSFNDARLEPHTEQYKRSFLPVAYLLEGTFTSAFANRLTPETIQKFNFKERNKESSILVVSDGDFVTNEFSPVRNQVYDMGYDRFGQMQFANKDFLLNVLAYMVDGDNLVLARSKTVTLRPLDKVKLDRQKTRWQALNMGAPVILVLLFGLGYFSWRKRRYTRFKTA